MPFTVGSSRAAALASLALLLFLGVVAAHRCYDCYPDNLNCALNVGAAISLPGGVKTRVCRAGYNGCLKVVFMDGKVERECADVAAGDTVANLCNLHKPGWFQCFYCVAELCNSQGPEQKIEN